MISNLESAYNDKVGTIHRRKFGQFFTDTRVASFMVNWVCKSGLYSIYDPAFGLGAFYSAINKKRDVLFSASEIDSYIVDFWKSNHQDTNPKIKHEDYLNTWGHVHDNIVCNPPYMRFQKFIGRYQVFQEFENRLGIRLSGYTNIASAFLIKSLSELRQGGRLAYIMPLEFLNSGYGILIKEKLLEKSWLRAIISFNCEKDVFPDVTTSVGIILIDSVSKSSIVDFCVVSRIGDLDTCLERLPVQRIPIAMLNPSEKWLQHFQQHYIEYNNSLLVPLNYYGRFSRGIATGANEFFVSSIARFKDLQIGDDEIAPCITKSFQIKESFFAQIDYDAMKLSNANVLLFSPSGSLSDGAREYVRFGETSGYHKRFLTKNRNPWFKAEVRSPSPILLGVFSRGGYKVVRNTSNALNLTCFHGFQPNLFGLSYVDCLFLYLLSDAGRLMISLNMRKYGDSLDKFEPNDLNNALVPSPEFFDTISKTDIQEAMENIVNNNKTHSISHGYFSELLTAQQGVAA